MRAEATRLAIISMHTDPLAPLGGDFTGGMNVYVREIAKAFANLGVETDVFTRLESDSAEPQVPFQTARAWSGSRRAPRKN